MGELAGQRQAGRAGEPVHGRRDGQQLESALLAAGWDELVEVGYARLTMGSVAVRARTSEPVLYRRWANKDQLVLAAIEHHRNANPVAVPDTGGLRSDLLAQLTAVSEALAGFFAIARSTWGASAQPCSPCRSTWCDTTCSWTSSR